MRASKSVSLLSIVMIFSIHLSRKCYNGCILKFLKSLLGLSHKYSVNLEGNLSIPMNEGTHKKPVIQEEIILTCSVNLFQPTYLYF